MEGDFIAVLAGIGAQCWELRSRQFLKHDISHAKVGACYSNTSIQIILVLLNSNIESILLQENNIIQRKDIRCFLSVKKLMLSINEREKHHMFFIIYGASDISYFNRKNEIEWFRKNINIYSSGNSKVQVKGKQLLSFVANKDSVEAEASMNWHGKTGGGQENTFSNEVT